MWDITIKRPMLKRELNAIIVDFLYVFLQLKNIFFTLRMLLCVYNYPETNEIVCRRIKHFS